MKADDLPPPWVALPDLAPFEPANQGAGDAYYSLNFLPFWRGLTPAEKAAYLDRWNATPDWRACIAQWFDSDLDLEEDARDSAAWAAAHPLPEKRGWRLFRKR